MPTKSSFWAVKPASEELNRAPLFEPLVGAVLELLDVVVLLLVAVGRAEVGVDRDGQGLLRGQDVGYAPHVLGIFAPKTRLDKPIL